MLRPVSGFTTRLHCRSRGPTTGGKVNLDTDTTTRTTSRILTRSIPPGEKGAGGGRVQEVEGCGFRGLSF